MGRSKASAQESQSLDNSNKQTQAGGKTLGDVNKSLDYFTGSDPTQTSLYKSLLTTGTDSTNAAYNGAKAADKLHANVSGFGYASPVGTAADAGVETSRAADLSKVPGQALQTTVGDELAADQIKSGVGSTMLGSANDNMKTSNEAEMQRQRMSQAWLQALSGVAGGAAGVAGAYYGAKSGG